jgi:hypothetical protein
VSALGAPGTAKRPTRKEGERMYIGGGLLTLIIIILLIIWLF